VGDNQADTPANTGAGWLPVVRELLEQLAGNHIVLLPISQGEEIVDFEIVAASPQVVDSYGRPRDEMIGSKLRETYAAVVKGEVWQAYRAAYLHGRPTTVGPFSYPATSVEVSPPRFTVRLRRIGDGLLASWNRHDDLREPKERIAQTERLANLGWSERDLIAGTTSWSDQLYRIFERDPAAGPMSPEEIEAVTVPADRPLRRRATERLSVGSPADVTYRIRVGGKIKHVRTIADTIRDLHGRPMRIFGIVQDVTARVTNRTRLAQVEQRLHEQQQNLAAESRLVTELQQIILPIPLAPFDLSGLRVAVRYLPAEQASRIGGDWFHAGVAFDGSVILAVGDVAGHGIRAAATMAQLRQAFVTLSTTATSDPDELLRYLNRLLLADPDGASIASAVVARFDRASQTIQWAQAGHPAPLHTRKGATTQLARPPGTLLGALPDPVYTTTSFTIRPGDLLLLYTDGLIERRGRTLEEGLTPVIATLNELTAEARPAPLADLLSQLRRANPRDDTCILAARLNPAEAASEQMADAGSHFIAGSLQQT
jgi:serine phosphatase RsbU (regulator of sigma subunit)